MKIHLILLAAGNSRRFGGNKLVSFLNGKPLYQYLTDSRESILGHESIMKIHLILLAAGNSRRFGGNKLVSFLNGKPLYQYLTDC